MYRLLRPPDLKVISGAPCVSWAERLFPALNAARKSFQEKRCSPRAALPMVGRCGWRCGSVWGSLQTVLTFRIKEFICISETKCLVTHKLHYTSSTPLKPTLWGTSSQDPVCDCTPMVQTPCVSRCRCSTPNLAPESHKRVVPHTPTLPTRLRSRGLPNLLSP